MASLSEFGARIKQKYPQYADLDDADLGRRMLVKYPQYRDLVDPDAPTQGERSSTGATISPEAIPEVPPAVGPTPLGRAIGGAVAPFVEGAYNVVATPIIGAERLLGKTGLLPEGTAEQTEKLMRAPQTFLRGLYEKDAPVAGAVARGATELAGSLAIPGGVGGGLLGRAGVAAGQGALSGAGATQNVEAAGTGAAVGAVFGAALQGAGEGFGKGVNRLRSFKELRHAHAARDADEITQIFGEAGMRPTVAELSGDAGLQAMQHSLATGRHSTKFVTMRNEQKQTALQNLEREVSRLGGAPEQAALGDRVRKTYETAVRSMIDFAHANWQSGLAPLRNVLGDKKVVTLDSTLQLLDDTIQRMDHPDNPGMSAIANELRGWKQALTRGQKQAVQPQQGSPQIVVVGKTTKVEPPAVSNAYSLDQVNEMLTSLTDKLRKTDPHEKHMLFGPLTSRGLERRLARDMRNTLLDDLDSVVATLDPETVGIMRQVRDQYRKDWDKVRDVQKSVLGAFLDRRGAKSDEDIYSQIVNLKPSQMRLASKLIDEYSPELGGEINSRLLQDALNAARVAEDPIVGSVNFNVAKFLKSTNSEAFKLRFPEEGMRTEFASTLKALERISKTKLGTGSRNIAQERGSEAGTAVGIGLGQPGSLLFAAIYGIKYGGMDKMAQLFADPTGREAIRLLDKYKDIPLGARMPQKLERALMTLAAELSE